jgi:hypothetical protein
MGSAIMVFVDTGASPQPQSYVASRLAQSNSGLCNRSFTWLCKKQSLEDGCERVLREDERSLVYHPAADFRDDVCVHVNMGGFG